jgi:hypothetical protein
MSPIFILGIFPRSGTNYLHDLIRMHPECDPESTILHEDHLVANAHLLLKYVDAVSRSWKTRWGSVELEAEREALCAELGNGLVSFLSSQLDRRKQVTGKNGIGGPQRRLVTKTPSVKNLGLFSKLFPASQLLILVRDGRSVVESSVKTFNQPYGYATREWARAARVIEDFQRKNQGTPYLLVRYEDLYKNVEQELRRIFHHLQLDPEVYDYAAAANLPVRGSSTLRGRPASYRRFWVAEGIHWDPVQKPMDFNPIDRWSNWDRAKHERFNWLAGEHLNRFGYSQKTYPGGRLVWTVRNIVLDFLRLDTGSWLLRRVSRRLRTVNSVGDFIEFIRYIGHSVVEAAWQSVNAKE